jgi:hypothetical protein
MSRRRVDGKKDFLEGREKGRRDTLQPFPNSSIIMGNLALTCETAPWHQRIIPTSNLRWRKKTFWRPCSSKKMYATLKPERVSQEVDHGAGFPLPTTFR